MLPINPYAPELRRTIGDLRRDRRNVLAICRHCKHEGLIFTVELAVRFGEDFPAVRLREHVRCSGCRRINSAVLQEVMR